MALSGYLLQVVSSPAWLTGLVWAHVSTSLVFVTGYGMHLVVGWRLSQVAREASGIAREARVRP